MMKKGKYALILVTWNRWAVVGFRHSRKAAELEAKEKVRSAELRKADRGSFRGGKVRFLMMKEVAAFQERSAAEVRKEVGADA